MDMVFGFRSYCFYDVKMSKSAKNSSKLIKKKKKCGNLITLHNTYIPNTKILFLCNFFLYFFLRLKKLKTTVGIITSLKYIGIPRYICN